MTRNTAASALELVAVGTGGGTVDEPTDDERTGEHERRRGRHQQPERAPSGRGRATAVRRGRATATPIVLHPAILVTGAPIAARGCFGRFAVDRGMIAGILALASMLEEVMAVRGMNHAVLYVSDVARTTEFYTEALGFRVITVVPGRGVLPGPGVDQRSRPRRVRDRQRRRCRPRLAAGPSGCTTWRGRSRRSATSNGSPACCPNARPSSARAITARRRACTPRTPTASSSRSSG